MKSRMSVASWRALAHVPIFKLLFASFSHAFPLAAEQKGWIGPASHRVVADDGETDAWLYLVIAAVLVLLGGAFAGLTIAYALLSF
jgi:hypothetical protein